MSEPKHHPDEAWLIAYAGGALAPPQALLIASHAAVCPACARRIREHEMVAAALFETLEPAPVTEAALQSLLARIDGAGAGSEWHAEAPDPGGAPEVLGVLPEPLQAVARRFECERGWKRRGRGVRTLDLGDGGGMPAILAAMEPGHAIPRHDHTGVEMTLVLQGGFHDHLAAYGPGDVAVAGPGLRHRPVADPGETCIAFAVAESDVRFTGLLGLFQRADGILKNFYTRGGKRP